MTCAVATLLKVALLSVLANLSEMTKKYVTVWMLINRSQSCDLFVTNNIILRVIRYITLHGFSMEPSFLFMQRIIFTLVSI
jgi:hypothetical protein